MRAANSASGQWAGNRVAPGQARQSRGHHGDEGHEHTHRVTRQGDDGHLPMRPAVLDTHHAVALRLARLHGDLGQTQPHRAVCSVLAVLAVLIILSQHDQGVEGAGRHPAGGDDEIGPARRLDEGHRQ